MDDSLSHPHIFILVFLASVFSVVAVLILLAAFVYLIRRRSALSVLPTKFSGQPSQSPSKLRLFFLRLKGTSSQVEPARTDEVKLPQYCDVGLSPAAGDGVVERREFEQIYSHARLLYTIKEEKESESESDHESFRVVGVSPSPSPSVVEGMGAVTAPATDEEGEDGDGRFFTPCSSPPFYTPSSSPLRAFNVVSDTAGVEEDEASPASKVGLAGGVPFPAFGYTWGQHGGHFGAQ